MEVFLDLSTEDRADILNDIARQAGPGKTAQILEKDIWLCWALGALFSMPNKLPMAFKGGTSLSKVFGLIDCFSEDIDITIDCKALSNEDPFSPDISKSKLKKLSIQLKSNVTEHIKDTILPYLEEKLAQTNDNNCKIELDDDGETVYLRYSSAISNMHEYLSESIKLEFGGRNLTVPNNTHTVSPYAHKYRNDLEFQRANVTVLSPERTFWEKATLIHVECNRTGLKADPDRISRHWYDIIQISQDEIGSNAIKNLTLLNEFVNLKKIFFNSGYANYDNCINGDIRLLPNNNLLSHLHADFNKMLDANMFYGEKPIFDDIMRKIKQLEETINLSTKKRGNALHDK